jgi:hypothetical protein
MAHVTAMDSYLDDIQYCVDKCGDAGHKQSLKSVREYFAEIAPSTSTNSLRAEISRMLLDVNHCLIAGDLLAASNCLVTIHAKLRS